MKGIRLTTVKVASEADDFFVDVKNSNKCKRTEIMIYHGYFILLLFKNVSSNNYNAFFSRRITAMKSLSGYPDTWRSFLSLS